MDKSLHGLGVGGRLKQRLAHILLRSSCTTTTTTSPTAFVGLANTNDAAKNAASRREPPPAYPLCAPCADARPKIVGDRRPRRRRMRLGAPLVHISIDYSGGGGGGDAGASGRCYVHSVGAALLPPQSLPGKDGRKSKGGKRGSSTSKRDWAIKRATSTYSCSSSTVTDDELAAFSSDEGSGNEAETRTLFSSLSFSSDSPSEFYSSTSAKKSRHKKTPRRQPKRAPSRAAKGSHAFRPAASTATTKHHREKRNAKEVEAKEDSCATGMAVVKQSCNPYSDFRSSMVEMVVERRICRAGEMEELLGSYLSLNSRRHHPAILAAFEDVWEALFGDDLL